MSASALRCFSTDATLIPTSAAAAPTLRPWTREEYLTFERASEEKHEFVDGFPVTMAGGPRDHALICSNIVGALHAALAGSPCEAYTSDMKVHVHGTERFRYPDASLSCEPAFLDDTKDVLTTPCVVFEVLSKSTESTDRGEKFDDYRTIPTFAEYVLVRQQRMLVEHYTRQPDGTWSRQILPAGEVLRLRCARAEIPVRELYHKVF